MELRNSNLGETFIASPQGFPSLYSALANVHMFLFWRSRNEEVLMSPRGVVVAGAKVFNSCYSFFSSDEIEKQEIELLNVKITITLPFPVLIDVP